MDVFHPTGPLNTGKRKDPLINGDFEQPATGNSN